jgi:hypothetical protein
LDVYSGPVGSADLAAQIHDYNVHIDVNDVFWTVRLPHRAVDVNFGKSQASLRVSGLEVFDDHDLANSLTYGLGLPQPPIPSVLPVRAKVSFNVEWDGALATAPIENTAQRFKGTFLSTQATIKWSAEQPGFRFESEAPNPARNLMSVLGNEQNGVFFR